MILESLIKSWANCIGESDLFPEIRPIANFKTINFPLVRRIYPQLIANKIISVQPLSGPTSLIYYLRNVPTQNKPKRDGDSW